MDQTPEWLKRKFKQAEKERWEDSRLRIHEGVKSLSAVMDALFNKGNSYDKIIPLPYEEVIGKMENQNKTKTQFVSGSWWKSEQ